MSISQVNAPAAESPNGAGPNQDTALHRAMRRLAEEFLGTATGPAPHSIALFGVRGFPDTDVRDQRRETYERIRAGIGADLAAVLEERLSEAELAGRLTDVADQYRVRSYESADRDARDAYAGLADAIDGSVYYNRDPHAERLHQLRRRAKLAAG